MKAFRYNKAFVGSCVTILGRHGSDQDPITYMGKEMMPIDLLDLCDYDITGEQVQIGYFAAGGRWVSGTLASMVRERRD